MGRRCSKTLSDRMRQPLAALQFGALARPLCRLQEHPNRRYG